MKQTHRSILLLLMLLLSLNLVGCASLSNPDKLVLEPSGETTENLLFGYAKVCEGMSLQGVLKILGQPFKAENGILYYYGQYHAQKSMSVRVYMKDERVTNVDMQTWWDHPE